MYEWSVGVANETPFVMIDSAGSELSGLTVAVEIRKPAVAGFAAGGGTVTELGDGWYVYTSTAAEADTLGNGALKATASGAVQQNLPFTVKYVDLGNYKEWPYRVTKDGVPTEGARVRVSTDEAGSNVIWVGVTDVDGYARDIYDQHPYLPPGNRYFWPYKANTDFDRPDLEVVS